MDKILFSTLKVGDSAKISIDNKENVWVEITEIKDSSPKSIKGKVDVNPNILENVKFGDSVVFNLENILDILKN